MTDAIHEIRVALNMARRHVTESVGHTEIAWRTQVAVLESALTAALKAQQESADREQKLAGAVSYYRESRDDLDVFLANGGMRS